MAFRLRPVDTAFYDLFSEQAQHLVVGAGLLAEMLAEGADHAAVAQRMREAEHEADETTHAIVRRVNQTFVTPFDREDIYRLASGLDDVMDMMDEIVDLVLLYEVKTLPPELSEQVSVIQQCSDLTAAAMPKLQSPASLEEFWIEINRLENAGDRLHRQLLGQLLVDDAADVPRMLRLKVITDELERAVDAFEELARTIESIALKES